MLNRDNVIIVGMADLKVCKEPHVLTTLGLGSCIGICLYDPVVRVCGMAHIMLPDSTRIVNNANKAKFADTASIKLIEEMVRLGARKERLRAKLAGGAQMFAFNSDNSAMRIGDSNIESTQRIMKELNIPIIAQDCGSTYGRTIELYPENGNLLIKTISNGTKTI